MVKSYVYQRKNSSVVRMSGQISAGYVADVIFLMEMPIMLAKTQNVAAPNVDLGKP